MANHRPLDTHQQELVNVIKAAHQNLAVVRRMRSGELARRMTADRLRIEQDVERALEESATRVRMTLDAEVAAHESALDEALIAAYNAGVPTRRIGLDGFGNRYDGGAAQLIAKLRDDGRIGTRVGYQRKNGEYDTSVRFPEPIDTEAILSEATTIAEITFGRASDLTLVQPDKNGENGIAVPAVIITMDSRDPWFASIKGNARPGTQWIGATTAVLYLHPSTGELLAHESKELGTTLWDHPVARWVKENMALAREGFDTAMLNEPTVVFPELAE